MPHAASCGDAVLKITLCSLTVQCGLGLTMTNDIKSRMKQSAVRGTLQLVCNRAHCQTYIITCADSIICH